MRRPAGPALTREEIGEVLALPSDPSTEPWHHVVGADGSKFRLRLSTERGDRWGPAVGEPSAGEPGQRTYDCFIHVSIYWTTEDTDDSWGSLRAFCRSVVGRLHTAWAALETAFEVHEDYGYRFDPEDIPGRAELTVWVGSESWPPGASLLRLAEPAAPAGPPVLEFREVGVGDAGIPAEADDSVSFTLVQRSRELACQAAVRSSEVELSAQLLREFTTSLLEGLGRSFPRVDAAFWVGGRLYRSETDWSS
ncbi:hypothetical protein ACFC1R_35575 [Kitasatospora sp. NPDC056138]|uniref:hypothetical protein n=1 Tax=Kitasatospora sp. NPDC056138 TaxID=3345724 RepID=UPI0035DBADCC